jgi:6-phosphogluconolactonase
MEKLSRREFLITASAATVATAASTSLAASPKQRVFIASGTPDGILAYDWYPVKAELTPAGVASNVPHVAWITASPDGKYLYAASEVDSVNDRKTGAVAGFRVENGRLSLMNMPNSAGPGTCYVALDHTGRVLVSADYAGGSAASFFAMDGSLSPAIWMQRYTVHGPDADRQQSAHAHFASFSPDNRFVYINDLGGDVIHIYSLDVDNAVLKPAGSYSSQPGAGPRTLHFHPNGHTAYSVNELNSTVDVLEWNRADGSLALVTRIELLPAGYHGPTRACDTVITKDGKFVYFANRDNDFLYSFRAEFKTGALTPIARSSCGGKTPRNFTLDPTEHWMLVANQDSNLISIFARNPETGALADEGKSIAAATPMRILFL